MPKQTILVIDDEKDILKLVQYNLEKEGYPVLTAKTGEEGLELAKAKKPDLVILDLMLPGIDGNEVCKLLKSGAQTRAIPVLMLTAKGAEVDQVLGLELGASDYITKPFSVKVLLARVKNAFRRAETLKEAPALLRAGDLVIDKERQSFTIKGKPVALTKLEFRILGFLMENPGTVDVHVRSIRQKLGKHRDAIETVRGSGYRFKE
jgi:two-component system phosphate regulon response regulator PhoB